MDLGMTKMELCDVTGKERPLAADAPADDLQLYLNLIRYKQVDSDDSISDVLVSCLMQLVSETVLIACLIKWTLWGVPMLH